MSAIIDNAETIRYQRQVSIAQTKSQSGKRQAQRRGPLLYNFFIEVRPIQFGSDEYYAIEDEIIDSNYSANTVNSTITIGKLTDQRGAWSGAQAVAGTGNTSGNQIDIVITETNNGNTVTNYGRKGDFVQFAGYSKVYQLTDNANTIVSDATTATTTLNLNGAIPESDDVANANILHGSEVLFKLQLKERPEPEFSELDIVNYSSATFEEVL